MTNYIVKYWETEEDREQGNSEIFATTNDKTTAIEQAEKLFWRNSFACVEVQTETETYLTLEN